jgi:hypothetical protein
MTGTGKTLIHRPADCVEPNRRQQLALERIEIAVSELATVVVLSSCRASGVARTAMHDVRRAVAPILADILAAD